jgi:hypothetical protein
VQRRYPEGVPLLSPEEDMSVKDSAFRKAQRLAFWSCSCQHHSPLDHICLIGIVLQRLLGSLCPFKAIRLLSLMGDYVFGIEV